MLTGGEGDGGIQEKKKYILVSEEEFNVVLRALDEIAEQRDNLRNECSIQKKQLQQLLYV
jgi:tetrahydromethanopterin S-methyltransferase subunit G